MKTAIEQFLAEFAAFETHFVGMVLRSLSNDSMFVEQTESLLDLEARLKLLKRMAFVRDLDRRLITQLDGVNLRAARLRDKRDELRRNRNSVWVPTSAEIDECRYGTTQLQAILRSIAEQVAGRHSVS